MERSNKVASAEGSLQCAYPAEDSIPYGRQALDDPRVVDDLALRWRSARTAALRQFVGTTVKCASERDLLEKAISGSMWDVCKATFDHSRTLGRGFRLHHQVRVELEDLARLLPQLGVECASAVFEAKNDEPCLALVRSGCTYGQGGPALCAYWQEALSGLVIGLCPNFRLSRHGSVGLGDERCVDVVHLPQSKYAYAEIPADVRGEIEHIVQSLKIFDSTVTVSLLGVREHALVYQLSTSRPSQLALRTQFERKLRKRFPSLLARELGARAVLSDGR